MVERTNAQRMSALLTRSLDRVLVAAPGDIEERACAERHLRRQVDRQMLVVALGEQALMGVALPELIAHAVIQLSATLDTGYVAILRSRARLGARDALR
jgi:hypothetical protein